MYAVDWGHVPAYIHFFQDPKLKKNPDVDVCTYSEINEASEAFKYRAESTALPPIDADEINSSGNSFVSKKKKAPADITLIDRARWHRIKKGLMLESKLGKVRGEYELFAA